MDRCNLCDGRFDRPGLYGCASERHPKPDLAQRIAAAIEEDMDDRRGMSFGELDLDRETQQDIRDAWAAIVRKILAKPGV